MSEGLILDLVRRVTELQRKVERLEAIERVTTGTPADIAQLETYQMPNSDDNVGNPPTDADLDGAFGTPAVVGDGFIGFVDDSGNSVRVWLVSSDGLAWWYSLLDKAL